MDFFFFWASHVTCNKCKPNAEIFYKVKPKWKLSAVSLSNTESEEQKALLRNPCAFLSMWKKNEGPVSKNV